MSLRRHRTKPLEHDFLLDLPPEERNPARETPSSVQCAKNAGLIRASLALDLVSLQVEFRGIPGLRIETWGTRH